jgi:hypothetical protein
MNRQWTQISESASSLFAATPGIIENCLGLVNTRHWSALHGLVRNPPASEQIVSMVEALFAGVAGIWNSGRAKTNRRASGQNWRFVLTGHIGEKNMSPEVTLERAVARACKSLGRSDWANQMPVASGVLDGRSHRRTAIDLVHRFDSDTFEFVELKVGSDTPLHAAIEIIQYAMIWILSRRETQSLGYADIPVLNAEAIRLSVLAPIPFYRDMELAKLANDLSRAITILAAREARAAMSFEFQAFPVAFGWPAELTDRELCAALDGRQCWLASA